MYSKCTGEETTPIEVLPGKQTNETIAKDPLKCYPENLFNKVGKITGDFAEAIIGDGWLVSLETGEAKRQPKCSHVHLRHYRILVPEAAQYLKEHGGHLGVVKHNLNPLIHLTEGQDHLYIMMARELGPEELKFTTADGNTYTLVRWNQRTKAYTRAEKENIMAETRIGKLPSLVKQMSETLNIPEEQIRKEAGIADPEELTDAKMLEELTVEPEAPAVEEQPVEEVQAAEAEIVTQEAPVVEAPVEDVPPFKEDPVAEVQEEAVEDTAKPKKRVRAGKARCGDLADVITQVSSDVPDDMCIEDVMKELRQMRDLVIAATRRQANLALKYIDKNSDAEAVIQQIKGILK